MTMTPKICTFCLLSCLLFVGQSAQGQVPQSGFADQTSRDLSTPAMKYFGHGKRMPVPRPRARRQVVPTQRYQLTGSKPFQNVNRRPTISPYLGLDAIETSVSLPNYYSRVLPQIQQQEASQAQAAAQRRLQQQAHLAKVPRTVFNNRSASVPTTGYSAQFMNSGSYFPSIRQ